MLEIMFFVFVGSVLGLFVGSLPGLSVTMAVSILVSITYTWSVENALATIMGIYVVGVFSGAIPAILLNIPGAPSNIITTLDGYEFAKKSKAKYAIKISAIYSFVGSVFGLIVLFIFSKEFSKFTLMFTPLDYLLISILGFFSATLLTNKSFFKTFIMAGLGVFISLVGYNNMTGTARYTFGFSELNAGISVIPVLIGVFGFSEILNRLNKITDNVDVKIEDDKLSIYEYFKYFKQSIKYSSVGVLIGALPGAGSSVASLIAYSFAKKKNKNIGNGDAIGLVASESSNNACVGGALIPLLSLGIPGDAVSAVILSIFYIHGLNVGPLFITENIDAFNTIIISGFVASLFLLLLGLFIAPKMTFLIKLKNKVLLPLVFIFCVYGAYSYNYRIFDIIIMIVFGIFAYFIKKKDFAIPPLVLGIVLGKMIESNFNKTIAFYNASSNFFSEFIFRPITVVILVIIFVFGLYGVIVNYKTKYKS